MNASKHTQLNSCFGSDGLITQPVSVIAALNVINNIASLIIINIIIILTM